MRDEVSYDGYPRDHADYDAFGVATYTAVQPGWPVARLGYAGIQYDAATGRKVEHDWNGGRNGAPVLSERDPRPVTPPGGGVPPGQT